MEESLGNILIDGKFIDLDKVPLDELRKIQEEIEKKEEAKRKEIQELLDEEDIEIEEQSEER